MSYKINTTDGTLLVDLIDGRIDNNTTDLTLVGRNYTGYGEVFNENFVKLLENFRNTFPPANPLVGQLWFDSSEGRLKVYNGIEFRSTDTTIVSAIEPLLVSGDIWIDSFNKQIYFSDGVNKILAGPNYSNSQGKTHIEAATLVDNFGIERTVGRLFIGGDPVAIIAKNGFNAGAAPGNTEILNGFSTTIKAGVNVNSTFSAFGFNANASSADALKDVNNNLYTPTDFLTANGDNVNNGTLHVKNDNGLIVGIDSDLAIRVEQNTTFIRNRLNNSTMRFQVRQGFFDNDAITIKAQNNYVGIWKQDPLYGLDVNGSVRVSGDLIVEGNTTNLDVANLTVEDKTIELARSTTGTFLSDTELDGAGIVIKGSVSDKSLLWNNVTNTFNFNTPLNITDRLLINGSEVLNPTTLASTVTTALGITQVGSLVSLTVDDITIDGSVISSTSNITLKSTGDIAIRDETDALGAVKIFGVAKPIDTDTDDAVATKGYVDERYQFEDVRLTLDITGLTNAQVALLLEDLYPSAGKNVGVYAYLHCISYTGSMTYNGADGLSKTFVAVDKNGIENQSVLQDISFTDVVETVTFSPTRAYKRFRVVSPSPGVQQWEYDIDLPSSV